VQLQEVIRIIGPFPNVKNVLQGVGSTVASSSSAAGSDNGTAVVSDFKLVWDSMVDGTGKEVLAGGESKNGVRTVDLHVYLADASVLIAVVPPALDKLEQRRLDPLQDNCKHVLLFLREDDLDSKLEALRVA
jgi:hypothetical protein